MTWKQWHNGWIPKNGKKSNCQESVEWYTICDVIRKLVVSSAKSKTKKTRKNEKKHRLRMNCNQKYDDFDGTDDSSEHFQLQTNSESNDTSNSEM